MDIYEHPQINALMVNGQQADFIGSGVWTKAFRIGNSDEVYLKSKSYDPFKDAFTQVEHPNLPKIKKLGPSLYVTEYSTTPAPINGDPIYDKIKALQAVRSQAQIEARYDDAKALELFVEKSREILTEEEHEALAIIYELAHMYTDIESISFDMKSDNFGVRNGKIIFRDIVYDGSTLYSEPER
jgi:hypothetical protein